MKTVAIVQARMGSTRLPGKMMLDLGGKPAIQRVIDRVEKAELVDQIVLATSTNPLDDVFMDVVHGIIIFRGSENDVMDRVLNAAIIAEAGLVVEITGDCPLIDPYMIDQCVKRIISNPDLDYVSNCVPLRSYPDGLDVQVYKTEVLEKMSLITDPDTRKHVGWNIPQHNSFEFYCITAPPELYWPELRITLDTKEDYGLISHLYERYGDNDFNSHDIVRYLGRHPELITNKHIKARKPEEG